MPATMPATLTSALGSCRTRVLVSEYAYTRRPRACCMHVHMSMHYVHALCTCACRTRMEKPLGVIAR
eukprot:scaffold90407_cov55-Phaeocystis_antarctica.AAC.2